MSDRCWTRREVVAEVARRYLEGEVAEGLAEDRGLMNFGSRERDRPTNDGSEHHGELPVSPLMCFATYVSTSAFDARFGEGAYHALKMGLPDDGWPDIDEWRLRNV